jgi:hypothetical protein
LCFGGGVIGDVFVTLTGTSLACNVTGLCASCAMGVECSRPGNGHIFCILSIETGGCITPPTFAPITVSGPGTYVFSATLTVSDPQFCQCGYPPPSYTRNTTGTITIDVTVVIT